MSGRTDSRATSCTRFAEQLFAARLLIPTGARGVFGRSSTFDAIVSAVQGRIDDCCATDGAQRVSFPPFTPRDVIGKSGYMEAMPQLLGSVHAFGGDERRHRDLLERVESSSDWGACLQQTELTLSPACCYPLYPTLAGSIPASGRLFDLTSYCFRHEPSDDPTRMQAFQMREHVYLGSAEDVEAWLSSWMERARVLLGAMGLSAELVHATDPFFGRGGRMMKASQREQGLKHELLVPVCGPAPTAVASFNAHLTHFTETFGIVLPDGSHAHSACLGFGLERVVLALLSRHGLEPSGWPGWLREAAGA